MSGGGSGFGKKSGPFGAAGGNPSVYLNLTPLMDVMSNILFFLLSAFGATIVAIMPATVPVVASGEPSAVSPEDEVTATVRVDASGIEVGCESPVHAPNVLAGYKARLPKKGGNHDLPGLTLALKRMKEAYRGSRTMVLVPDDDMIYEQVVLVMDAARSMTLPGGQSLLLFPDVVLSSVVTTAVGKTK